MFSFRPTRSLAALAAVVGLFAAAGIAFSGDAYVNEMGVIGRSADGIIAILIGL
jgi:hypothetical protein